MGKISSLHIGIDASRLTVEEKTGVEVYSNQIIKRLLERSDAKFTIWAKQPAPIGMEVPKSIDWKILSTNTLWTQGRFALELLTHKLPDVIFIPSHVIPFFHRGTFVVTIHDLAFLKYPEIYSKQERRYQNFAVKTAARTAKLIITPSQATKNDLCSLYNIARDKVRVVHHGVDMTRFNQKNNQQAELPFMIKKPYILYSGRIESKKNLINLITAYGLLRQEQGITAQLVLCGKPGYGYDSIMKKIQTLPPQIAKDVIETGYVSDATYTQLMLNAAFYVFPSLYEGFGLPILEAMSTGVPVIASNTSSIPEIAGDAAILVDGKKPLSFAAAISRLIHHPKERADLIQKGFKQASQFSWDKAAEETMAVLRDAAGI